MLTGHCGLHYGAGLRRSSWGTVCTGLLLSLPPGLAKEVDATVCNFLKVAWRKRQTVWTQRGWCSDKDGWKLVL